MNDASIRSQLQIVRQACGALANRYGMIADVLLETQSTLDQVLHDQPEQVVQNCRSELTDLSSDLKSAGSVEAFVSDLDGFQANQVMDRIFHLKDHLLSVMD